MLHCMYGEHIVFADESGDHGLDRIDPDYPVFVLSFCLIRKDVYCDVLTPRIRRLKMDAFGHDLVILHEHDIRKRIGAFSRLDFEDRVAFIDGLTSVMASTPLTVFAVVINKPAYRATHPVPAHPYHLAMQHGLESIGAYLGPTERDARRTHVVFESRGAKEDRTLEAAFRRVDDSLGYDMKPAPFDIIIADKKVNSEGLQIADLTARPIGLSVVHPGQANRAMDVLRQKFARIDREAYGHGLKILP